VRSRIRGQDASPVRGEVWLVDLSPGRGSEQSGNRPAVIVQNDPANRNSRYPNTVVVAVSTKGRDVPTHVAVEPDPDNGLSRASYVKCEQVLTISKGRLKRRLGRLESRAMERVNAALRVSLAL